MKGYRSIEAGNAIRMDARQRRRDPMGARVERVEMIVGDTRDCMGNLDRRLSDIGDRVGNLERNVSDIGNRVGNLEKGLEAVNTKVSDIGDRVTRIEGRLDATASKEDLHRELTAMTWRLITFASSAGTALVAGTYYIARNVH